MQETPRHTADIVALGELLVDFASVGTSPSGSTLFERNAGGAPANFLAAASACGLSTLFVGCVGNDQHGRFLARSLRKAGVGTEALRTTDSAFTTLAFVDIDPMTKEREFSFARKPGADTLLSSDDIPFDAIADCRAFHAGSLSLTDEPARSATLSALAFAQSHGILTSFDVNWRASLWPDENTAVSRIKEALSFVDLVKASEEEVALITGLADPAKAANEILAHGAKLVAVTLGAGGCLVAWRDQGRIALLREEAFPCEPVDTTGAGDVFWGFFVATLVGRTPPSFDEDDVRACAKTANAAASLCVEAHGGISAVPPWRRVQERARRALDS